jgi:hypothetical protein
MNSIDYIRKVVIKIIKEEFMISEKLGVPENIIEISQDLYEKILKELSNQNLKYQKKEKEFNFLFNFFDLDYKISDYNIESISLVIQTLVYEQLQEDVLVSMSFKLAPKIDYNKKTIYPNYDAHRESLELVDLGMRFAFNDYPSDPKERLKSLFLNKKTQIISSISHELKHAFDKFKNRGQTISSLADYSTVQTLRFNISEIDEFLYNSYYMHFVENLVRPTEIATEIKLGNVDKKEFINFLKNNETYNRLLKIRNFSYSEMKQNLLKKSDEIRENLLSVGKSENNNNYIDTVNSFNTEELVDETLKLLFNNIASLGKKIVTDMLVETMMEEFGFITDFNKLNYIESYVNKYKKYGKNYDKFFEDEEKRFKFTANRILKKIHKLYDMAKDNKDSNEKTNKLHKKITDKESVRLSEEQKNSIHDWDLYHKLKNDGNPNYNYDAKF